MVFLSARAVRVLTIIVVCLILVLISGRVALTIARRVIGVKPGVVVEGVPVGGLLRSELMPILRELAEKTNRPPQNAMYYVESGEVIAEKPGVMVDLDETADQVLKAPENGVVRLTTIVMQPTITAEYFKPIYQGPPHRKAMALVINVAWGEEFLPAMLDILESNGVQATFFFVGSWVRQYPELVRKIAQGGHEIANHGLYHGHPTQMGRSELVRVITENQELLAQAAGQEPSKLFAPPYGEVNDKVAATAAEIGYRTIMWTRDTIDWQRPAPDTIVARATREMTNGNIILMHPTSPTIVALPRIIKTIRDAGYKLVTVSELLDGGAPES
ncbi:MAG: polysaccharide deacetylase family protein [Bacillota bacterium]